MAICVRTTAIAAVALAVLTMAAQAGAEIVTGWAVHNGSSTVGGTATNPTFTPGDNITVMAPFSTITLTNDGDFIYAAAPLTMNNRSPFGVNTLNTQLRIGLFSGPAGAVMANDVPNVGFIIEYTNLAAGGLIREQQSLTQVSPFTSPTNLGNGVQDSGGDSIQGANPGPVLFELTLTRNAGKIDLLGKISGTDSVNGNPYLSTYTVNGISSANFPENGTFSFNRIALFLGDGVNAASAVLNDVLVTNVVVPESRFGMLAVAVAMGAVLTGLKLRRSLRLRNQPQA